VFLTWYSGGVAAALSLPLHPARFADGFTNRFTAGHAVISQKLVARLSGWPVQAEPWGLLAPATGMTTPCHVFTLLQIAGDTVITVPWCSAQIGVRNSYLPDSKKVKKIGSLFLKCAIYAKKMLCFY
jgi:hypothetical protein